MSPWASCTCHLPKNQVQPNKMTDQFSSRASATRPFVIAAYHLIEGERPVAEVPAVCPWAELSASRQCRVTVKYHRDRKTGPEFPILVACCKTHGRSFAVYPPGHVPYGRKAIVPSGLDGSLLQHAEGEQDAGEPAWAGTVVDAAVDAAQGRLWDTSSPSRDSFRRRTQGRWLSLVASLLGLAAVDERSRERLAEQIGIAALDVMEAARAFERSLGLRDRGTAIVGLLGKLPVGQRLCDDLLVCGAIIGRWGRPLRWEVGGPLGGVMRALL